MPNVSYSASDIKDYVEYIIKKHETLTATYPIYVNVNRINNRLVLKIKNGYKIELQTSKKMKSCCITKQITDKTKNGEHFPSPEVIEVVLV